ncbi:MAG: serine/threonine protein kinase [Planctomycetes bacterium]|nr:serine/threonine protein kinase [Planctomycetota bacterium]
MGPYAIEAPIARGGMGAVYRAVDRRSGRRVALKLVLAGRAATPEQRRRFAREVEAQRALDTDGVVRVLDADAAAEVPWYAMELVDGPSLGAAKADLDLRRRVEVLAGVARAIGAAHAKGYLHRDLKPDNVLLERRGEALVPRVTDFGLAKQVGGESRLTADGAVLGTPHYMAPEQATGEVARAGPPTDVFALGVMLYELATGRLPFEGQTALELLAQIVEADPPPFESGDAREVVDADGPRALLLALEPVARRALEKRPEDRYATAGDLALDLERALQGEPTAAGLLRRARPRRRAVVATLGLVALVGLGVGLGAVALRWRVAREAEAAARAARAQALKELERATAAPGVEAVALLGALARAQEAFDLDPTLARRARLRLLDLALAAEDGEVALDALTRAPVTRHDLDALPAAERAAALLARGRLRVRVGDPTHPELEPLRALGPEHAPAVALLEGAIALAAPDLEAAAAAFERAAADPALAPGAHALRAHALGRLGRVADAQAAAERAGSGPEARRRLAEGLLLSLGQPPTRPRSTPPGARSRRPCARRLRVARRLLALARATGRAWRRPRPSEAAAARPTRSGARADRPGRGGPPPGRPARRLARSDRRSGRPSRPGGARARADRAAVLCLPHAAALAGG